MAHRSPSIARGPRADSSARSLPILLLGAALLTATSLAAAPRIAGFGYCAPPVIPGCIEQMTSKIAAHDRDACAADVQRFTRSLGAYRLCLVAEMGRAVSTGNDAIGRFRCRVDPSRPCP